MILKLCIVVIFLCSYAEGMESKDKNAESQDYYYMHGNYTEDKPLKYKPLCIFKAKAVQKGNKHLLIPTKKPNTFHYNELPLEDFERCFPYAYKRCFDQPIEVRELTHTDYVQYYATVLQIFAEQLSNPATAQRFGNSNGNAS